MQKTIAIHALVIAAAFVAFTPNTALANPPPPDEDMYDVELDVIRPSRPSDMQLELTVGIGAVERSNVISQPVPSGYGYELSGGLQAEAEARLMWRASGCCQDIMSYGVSLRGSHTAGAAFGLDGAALSLTTIDLLFVARSKLPCMSGDDMKVYVSVFGGLMTAIGFGGLGDGMDPGMERDQNARSYAAETMDHVGLGGVLGATGEVHFGHFILGLSLNIIRQYAGSDSVERGYLPSASLKFGGAIDL